jgi:hypothetical protein
MPVTSLPGDWLDRLALTRRRPPELYLATDDFADSPHAASLRVAFEELELSAVFCVEHVPTVAFVVLEEERLDRLDETHRALWNQGLMTLLLVLSGDLLRAYSLARLPRPLTAGAEDRRLVAVLERLRDALELKNLILGVESGRWWVEHADAFDSSERVDRVLLDNLMTAFRELGRDLPPDAAQALLMQTMFIAYLEDRDAILEPYFREATGGRAGSFAEILAARDVGLLEDFFGLLRRDFNGDIFLAPCAFEPSDDLPRVQSHHFAVLERFRAGREIMETGQGRLWAYDFRYIPVVLLSAVYDRFLAENPDARRRQGAYYTPMFLADTVVSQVWDVLDDEQRTEISAIDPACGSGIFIVRVFQRIVEHKRASRSGKAISWDDLVSIARRLHGMDISQSALRIAVFSLYIALLEQITPPDIRALMRQGRFLPKLWGRTLVHGSFFETTPKDEYDLVIGNPPWASRRGDTSGARQWCDENNFPCPSDEAAWGFVWK